MKTYATPCPVATLRRSRIAGAIGSLLVATVSSAADAPGRPIPAAPMDITSTCAESARGCQTLRRESRDHAPRALPGPSHAPAGGPTAGEPEGKPEYENLMAAMPNGGRDLPDFQFNDSTLLRRFQDMHSLPVMTIWQSHRTQVYLGLDQSGLAGLHFRQRRGLGERTSLWHSQSEAPQHTMPLDGPPKPRSVSP